MHGLVKFAITVTVIGSTAYGAVKLFHVCKAEYDRQVHELKSEINATIKNITVIAEKDQLMHNTARDSLINMGREEVGQADPDIKRLEKILRMLRDELNAIIQSK